MVSEIIAYHLCTKLGLQKLLVHIGGVAPHVSGAQRCFASRSGLLRFEASWRIL